MKKGIDLNHKIKELRIYKLGFIKKVYSGITVYSKPWPINPNPLIEKGKKSNSNFPFTFKIPE